MTKRRWSTWSGKLEPYGLVTANVHWELTRELYGADADGNRGEMREEIEAIELKEVEAPDWPALTDIDREIINDWIFENAEYEGD